MKKHYEISFEKFSILMFHPVTTEVEEIKKYASDLVDEVLSSDLNYIVILPNNDLGSSSIFNEFIRLENKDNFKIYPSIRFEYFLVLLKYSQFIIGNSSTGIREAPYYGVPTINIGTRQQSRSLHSEIINCNYSREEINLAIKEAIEFGSFTVENNFGSGRSDQQFLEIICNNDFWESSKQKLFKDR